MPTLKSDSLVYNLFIFIVKYIILPKGHFIIYNKYSSTCIMHLSCMNDEIRVQE